MLSGLTGFDLVVLALVGLFLLVGLARGLVAETLSLAAWVAAALAVRLFHEPVTRWLMPRTGGEPSAVILAFLGLFFGTIVLGRLLAGLLGEASRRSAIGPLDRLAGGAFGAAKGVLLASVLFVLVQFLTGFFDPGRRSPAWLMESRSAPLLSQVAAAMIDWLEEAAAFPDVSVLPEDHPPVDPSLIGPAAPEPAYTPEDNRRLEELIEKGEAVEL
ncbi:CvpA family protein [Thermaurantiacus sp.]